MHVFLLTMQDRCFVKQKAEHGRCIPLLHLHTLQIPRNCKLKNISSVQWKKSILPIWKYLILQCHNLVLYHHSIFLFFLLLHSAHVCSLGAPAKLVGYSFLNLFKEMFETCCCTPANTRHTHFTLRIMSLMWLWIASCMYVLCESLSLIHLTVNIGDPPLLRCYQSSHVKDCGVSFIIRHLIYCINICSKMQ